MVASTSGAGQLPQTLLEVFKPPTPPAPNPADPVTDPVVVKTAEVSNQAIVSVPSSDATPKKHVWKTVADCVCSPFKYLIAKIVNFFSSIGHFFSDIFNEEDDDYPYQLPAHEDSMVSDLGNNANVIKQWTGEIQKLNHNAKELNNLLTTFDISSPQALLNLLQIPETLSSSLVEGLKTKIKNKSDELKQTIASLESQVKKEEEAESSQTQLVNPTNSSIKTNLLELRKQRQEFDALQGEVETFLKEQSSENVRQHWQDQFVKESGKIAKEFEKIQQNTLTTISQIKPPINTHKDLKVCNDYFKIFQALETFKVIAQLEKLGVKSADILARHQEIIKISDKLSIGLEQGITNIGNTCWLNSAIQSMRKSPALVDLIKAPLKPKQGESEADWTARNRMHRYIKKAIYAVEFGEPSEVENALRRLRQAMITTTNVNIVPGEIANPNRERDQHDVSHAFTCFLTVIDYQLKFVVHRKVNDIAVPVLGVKSEIACKFSPTSSTTTMQKFLEDSAITQGVINEDTVEEEHRLAELPRVLVVQVSRFGIDETSKKRLVDITNLIRAAIQNEPGITRQDIINAGEVATRIKGSQLTGKIGRSINLRADEILDLRTSFLTEDLPAADRQLATFQLMGASCHLGGLGGGHYIAVGRKPDGTWWEFDDGKPVTPLTNDEVNRRVSTDGYQLIWERYTGPISAMPTEAEIKEGGEFVQAAQADLQAGVEPPD